MPLFDRDTSRKAYKAIVKNGMLSKQRMHVYRTLYKHGPATATELSERIKEAQPGFTTNRCNSRLGELRTQGVVQELGTRDCLVTGQNVILWDVTSKIPVPLPKRKTSAEKIRELEEEITFLLETNQMWKRKYERAAKKLRRRK